MASDSDRQWHHHHSRGHFQGTAIDEPMTREVRNVPPTHSFEVECGRSLCAGEWHMNR